MNNHIKQTSFNEKKLNLSSKSNEVDIKEISTEHIDKVLKVNDEILSILANNKCTVNESYNILLAMAESIYTYSVLKDFGFTE